MSKIKLRGRPLICTRHKAFVELLISTCGLPSETEIMEHAQADDVRGRHIFGQAPLHIACHAAAQTVIPLRVPFELRGTELAAEQLLQYAGEPETYVITRVPTVAMSYSLAFAPASFAAVQHCGLGKCGCGPRSYGSGDEESSTAHGTGDCYCECFDCSGEVQS